MPSMRTSAKRSQAGPSPRSRMRKSAATRTSAATTRAMRPARQRSRTSKRGGAPSATEWFRGLLRVAAEDQGVGDQVLLGQAQSIEMGVVVAHAVEMLGDDGLLLTHLLHEPKQDLDQLRRDLDALARQLV